MAATPPTGPKMERQEDVIEESLATPRLEELRPIVRQRLPLEGMVNTKLRIFQA